MWIIHGNCDTPTIGFYRKLHTYIKRQPNLSKVLIGRLYSVIDSNFQEKGSKPDNIYRFVDSIDTSFQTTDAESTFQDIIGHHKNIPEIRKLYYSLLADQVPVSKIKDIIRTVLKCFNPAMNVEN